MKKVIFGISIVVITIILLYSVNWNSSNEYIDGIKVLREEQERFLRFSPESPLAGIKIDSFQYFEPDKKYKVFADIRKIDGEPFVNLTNTFGEDEPYIRFAHAVFSIDGQTDSLTLYMPRSYRKSFKKAFVPFTDRTSGESTYGGGRYLDLMINDDQKIEIDFNLAYNPYCVYDASFVCPIPPKENDLSIYIKAGQKEYK